MLEAKYMGEGTADYYRS